MVALLNIFGDIEELVSGLYPYRYVITPIVMLLGAGAIYFSFRKGAHLFLWQHRVASGISGVPLIVLSVIAGNYLLSPLWERNFLEEASPLEAASVPTGPSTSMPDPASRTAIAFRGEFRGADDFHFGRGEALIVRTESGGHVLRFEKFSVRNGPDLYVYLSRDADGRRVEESLSLGRLKATDGAFNYEIPRGIDVSTVKSVVVWCRQFSVLFAIAPLAKS